MSPKLAQTKNPRKSWKSMPQMDGHQWSGDVFVVFNSSDSSHTGGPRHRQLGSNWAAKYIVPKGKGQCAPRLMIPGLHCWGRPLSSTMVLRTCMHRCWMMQ